ncbi:MAG: response regulator [Planctomycetota bacterium]
MSETTNESLRILIVDDDPDIRSGLVELLSEFGYQAASAEDGRRALQLLTRQPFDFAILDYKMPGMDGASLYREMREVSPQTAAIMITAWSGSDGAAAALNAGVWAVLRKPIDMDALFAQLEIVSGAPTVLLVDDDREFCDSLWQALNQNHIRVGISHSEAGGLSQACSDQFDVVIVDLQLGTGDGRRILRELRETSRPMRTIIVSGKVGIEDLQSRDPSFETQVDAIYHKPIDMEQLLEFLKPRLVD